MRLELTVREPNRHVVPLDGGYEDLLCMGLPRK